MGIEDRLLHISSPQEPPVEVESATPEPDPSSPSAEQGDQALDEVWFEEYKNLPLIDEVDVWVGNSEKRNEQRVAFEAGTVQNPTLDYPKLEDINFDEVEKTLLAFKEKILSQEASELSVDPEKFKVLQQVYRWKINERIAVVRMVRATKENNPRRFEAYNNFIYGEPTPELTSQITDDVHREAIEYKDSPDTPLATAADEVLRKLPIGEADIPKPTVPSMELVQHVKERTEKDLQDIMAIDIPDVSTEALEKAFSLALETLQAEGWKVVVDPDRVTLFVSQNRQTVYIPPGYIKSVEECRAIMVHEIGTHVARRLHGERSKLKLLGLGLDRYEAGEEGVATMREQAVMGEELKDFVHYDRYLAIALAKGVDGEPRDFRGVYDILYPTIRFRQLAEGKSEEEATSYAREQAWTLCVRTFRGTDCTHKGVCYTKDMAYREGNIATWLLMSKDLSDGMFFNVGKFDASSQRHIQVLTQLGILDEDLEHIEQDIANEEE